MEADVRPILSPWLTSRSSVVPMRRRTNWRVRRWRAASRRGRVMARAHWREKHERLRTRPIDADTLRRRTLHDARGRTLRHGVHYAAGLVVRWEIRRSAHGRVNQVDLLIDGSVWRTGARRTAERAVRSGRWRARRNDVMSTNETDRETEGRTAGGGEAADPVDERKRLRLLHRDRRPDHGDTHRIDRAGTDGRVSARVTLSAS